MKKRFLILSFLFVLIFNSCSDDSINLAGTTWTSAKDWYGKTRLSFEEGTWRNNLTRTGEQSDQIFILHNVATTWKGKNICCRKYML